MTLLIFVFIRNYSSFNSCRHDAVPGFYIIKHQIVVKCNFNSIIIVLMVRFSQNTYSGTEESGVVPVTLMLEGGTSPFVITVTVLPSDQSAEGKRCMLSTDLLATVCSID